MWGDPNSQLRVDIIEHIQDNPDVSGIQIYDSLNFSKSKVKHILHQMVLSSELEVDSESNAWFNRRYSVAGSTPDNALTTDSGETITTETGDEILVG